MKTRHSTNRRGTSLVRWLVVAGLCAASLSSVTGCEFLGLSEAEIQQPTGAPEAADPAPPPVPAEPVASVTEEYERPEYPAMARRNPFQPDVETVRPNVQELGDEGRTLEPLEQFGLGQLNLAAIISEVAVPKAMFIDPKGFGHVVKEGDRIGSSGGVISDIRENEVEVTEGVAGDEMKTRLRTVKLREIDLEADRGETLSEAEREALEKLLQTEEGRKAVERSYRESTMGGSAAEGEGLSPPGDRRFEGTLPPPSGSTP